MVYPRVPCSLAQTDRRTTIREGFPPFPASTKKRINTMLEGAKGQDPLAGRAKEAEIGKTESEAARNKALALNYAAETSERLAGIG